MNFSSGVFVWQLSMLMILYLESHQLIKLTNAWTYNRLFEIGLYSMVLSQCGNEKIFRKSHVTFLHYFILILCTLFTAFHTCYDSMWYQAIVLNLIGAMLCLLCTLKKYLLVASWISGSGFIYYACLHTLISSSDSNNLRAYQLWQILNVPFGLGACAHFLTFEPLVQ